MISTLSCNNSYWSSNKTVVIYALPSTFLCFSNTELKPPIVSDSNPPIEPLLSKINITSTTSLFLLTDLAWTSAEKLKAKTVTNNAIKNFIDTNSFFYKNSYD